MCAADEHDLLETVALRFDVLHIRYQMYAKETPPRFRQWLVSALQTATQRRPISRLDTVCKELFPELAVPSAALECTYYHVWMLPVATVALRHHLASNPTDCVELSICGRALRLNRPPSRKRPCPMLHRCPEENPQLLLPRRALARAGFRVLLPDDLRCATHALIAAVERRGGTVVRDRGQAACFLCHEEALVSAAAAEIIAFREQTV